MNGGAKFLATAAALAATGCGGERPQLQIRPTKAPLSATAKPVPFRIAEANAHLALGNVGLAVESFRKALREQPDSAEAMVGLALSYDQMSRFDLSRRYYESALAIVPADTGVLTAFARSLDLQGKSAEAAAVRSEVRTRLAAMKPQPAPAVQAPVAPRKVSRVQAPALGPSVTVKLPPARPVAHAAARPPVKPQVPAIAPRIEPKAMAKAPPPPPPVPVAARMEVAMAAALPAAAAAIPVPAKITEAAATPAPPPPPPPVARKEVQLVAAATSPAPPAAPVPVTKEAEPTAAAPPPAVQSPPAPVAVALKETKPAAAVAPPPPPAPVAVARKETEMAAAPPPPPPAPVAVARPVEMAIAPPPPAAPAAIAPKPAIKPAASANASPRLERVSLGEVALVTTGRPQWRPMVVTQTAQSTTVRFVPLRTAEAKRVKIKLLNAARYQGLAARTRRQFAQHGWRQLAIGNARRARQSSLILYPANRRDLAKRLSAQFGIAIARNATGTEIVVLLGRDAARRGLVQG